MIKTLKGIVVRATDINESDRMLNIYTAECGMISALAKGSRSLKSRKMSSTMQFCYSEFVFFEKGDRLWVKEAELIESFYGLRESLQRLALGGYVLEVLGEVATADGDVNLLRLTLNTLFAISSGKYELDKVKGAFEIRIASILGFMPSVMECERCGAKSGSFYFDIMAGAIECFPCHKNAEARHESLAEVHETHVVRILSEGARNAAVYCIHCPIERLFSFNLDREDTELFLSACECYLLNHLERGFKTLDFYNEVKR